MKTPRCRPSPTFSTASKVKRSFTQRHASNEQETRGVFQLYVIAALRPAKYNQKIGTINGCSDVARHSLTVTPRLALAVPRQGDFFIERPIARYVRAARRRVSTTSNRETMMPHAQPKPGKLLLSPSDHTLILIDHQSQMAFATKSIDPVVLRNNAALVAKAAKEFSVSTILTTVASKIFSGPIRNPETPSESRRRG